MFGNEEAERTALRLTNFQLASSANAPPSTCCVSLVRANGLEATMLGNASTSLDAFPVGPLHARLLTHCVIIRPPSPVPQTPALAGACGT